MAHTADWGICLARTSPDKPKHEGITCFFIDMRTPGIDVRPLKEINGDAWFNEVFFDDVFVPDDCVIGAVDDGWRAGRTTLANERVSMGGGASIGAGVVSLVGLAIVQLVVRMNLPLELPTDQFLAKGTGTVLDAGAGSGRSSLMVLLARPESRDFPIETGAHLG